MMKQQAKKSGVPLLVECKICEKQFNIVSIHSHIKQAHTAQAENVSCQVCGKVVTGCNLQQHMQHYTVHSVKKAVALPLYPA